MFGGDKIVTAAILDRVLHHSHVINIQGESYRLKEKKEAGLFSQENIKNTEELNSNLKKD